MHAPTVTAPARRSGATRSASPARCPYRRAAARERPATSTPVRLCSSWACRVASRPTDDALRAAAPCRRGHLPPGTHQGHRFVQQLRGLLRAVRVQASSGGVRAWRRRISRTLLASPTAERFNLDPDAVLGNVRARAAAMSSRNEATHSFASALNRSSGRACSPRMRCPRRSSRRVTRQVAFSAPPQSLMRTRLFVLSPRAGGGAAGGAAIPRTHTRERESACCSRRVLF